MFQLQSYRAALNHYIKAGSENCPPALLTELAHSEVDRIRLRVAENPRTAPDVLEILANDKNPDVRIAVGTNPSTPAHISYSLAFDEDPNVRFGLAENIGTSMELLEKLSHDVNPYVGCRAAETKELIRSRSEPNAFSRQRFFRWMIKGTDQPELRHA